MAALSNEKVPQTIVFKALLADQLVPEFALFRLVTNLQAGAAALAHSGAAADSQGGFP
jgi:hypothetical protein